jgi:hypothetical protein
MMHHGVARRLCTTSLDMSEGSGDDLWNGRRGREERQRAVPTEQNRCGDIGRASASSCAHLAHDGTALAIIAARGYDEERADLLTSSRRRCLRRLHFPVASGKV